MTRYLVLVIFTVMPMISACGSLSPEESSREAEATAETAQAITGTSKLCDAYVPNSWSDAIEVDDGWTIATCQNWAHSVGGTDFLLGCVFDNSYSWGSPDGGIPTPNCGWAGPPPPHGCTGKSCPSGDCVPVGRPCPAPR